MGYKRHKNLFSSLSLYTVLYVLVFGFMHWLFASQGKSFIWRRDGVYQHFLAVDYVSKYAEYLKETVFGQLSNGIPILNYSLGQGNDIFSLSAYDFTDIVTWLMVVIFQGKPEFCYEMIIAGKMYLAGVAFCLYCWTVGRKNSMGMVSGALVYVFSGFSLIMTTRHPNFMSGAYFLPLILMGAELYLRRSRFWVLVISTCLCAITSYYCFYMVSVIFAIYVIVRNWPTPVSIWKNKLKNILMTYGFYGLGVLLSSVLFIPAVYMFLEQSRLGVRSGYTASLWHYPLEYYIKSIEYFIVPGRFVGFWNVLGLAALSLVAVWLLFLKSEVRLRPHLQVTRAMVGVLFFGSLIPLWGLLMNGFGYVSNRWIYCFDFFAAFAVTLLFNQLYRLKIRELKSLVTLTLLMIIVFLLDPYRLNTLKFTSIIFLATTVTLVVVAHYQTEIKKRLGIFLVAIVVCNSVFNVYFTFQPGGGNLLAKFQNQGNVFEMLNSSASHIKNIQDDSFYRFESKEGLPNIGGYLAENTTSYWWSNMQKYVYEFYDALQMNALWHHCAVDGLDGRTALLSLASAKYYTIPSGANSFLPYGFVKVNKHVYRNQYVLPTGFAYRNYILAGEYKEKNPIERQQAMLQAVLLEEKPDYGIKLQPKQRLQKIEYRIKRLNGVTFNKGVISINKSSAFIDLEFPVVEGGELYLWFDEIALDKKDNDLMRIKVVAGHRMNNMFTAIVTKEALISNSNFAFPDIRKGLTYNLGYSKKYNSCRIYFPQKGKVKTRKIYLYKNPMSTYVKDWSRLNKNVFTEFKIETNRCEGTVDLTDNSLIHLALPYNKGWKAYVDGKETKILRANYMYMALPVQRGKHRVLLDYSTPLMKEGAVISLATFLILVVLSCKRKRIKPES